MATMRVVMVVLAGFVFATVFAWRWAGLRREIALWRWRRTHPARLRLTMPLENKRRPA